LASHWSPFRHPEANELPIRACISPRIRSTCIFNVFSRTGASGIRSGKQPRVPNLRPRLQN